MSVAAHHIIINILPGAFSHCVFLFTLVISKTFYLLKNYFPLFNTAINCDATPDSKQYLLNSSSVNTFSAGDVYLRQVHTEYILHSNVVGCKAQCTSLIEQSSRRYFALVWMNFFCLIVVVAFVVRGFLFILISVQFSVHFIYFSMVYIIISD